ncbi:MAG: AAA family ATPase [Acidobacteriia bacterium]|nr:AAA family ATPase [Terriglobia bacterium]
MFDYIKIEGFRSFKSVELEMPRLAVLIGPNGGGKSNLIDLLMLMTEAARGELAVGINRRGGFRDISFGLDASSEVRIEFHFRDLPSQISQSPPSPVPETPERGSFDVRYKVALRGLGVNFCVWKEHLQEEPPNEMSLEIDRERTQVVFSRHLESVPLFGQRKSVEDIELAIFQVRDPEKYPEPWALLREFQGTTFYRDIYTGPDSPIRQPSLIRTGLRLLPNGSNLSSVLYSIQQDWPDHWHEVSEILKTAYPDFMRLTVPPGGGDGKVLLHWFERPFKREGISANLLSDGTLKLLCMIAILKTPDPPPLICIDEPELGLHPDWIKLVAELLQDAASRTQVIVATHSPQIVAKLDPEQVIIAEKVDGESHLKRLNKPDLEQWLKDFNLSELWLAGHLGGRP